MHVIKMKVLLIDTQVRHMEICLAQKFILSLYLFIYLLLDKMQVY